MTRTRRQYPAAPPRNKMNVVKIATKGNFLVLKLKLYCKNYNKTNKNIEQRRIGKNIVKNTTKSLNKSIDFL